MIADLEQAVNHALVEGRRGVFAGTGATAQDGVIVGWGGAQAAPPLFHPAAGATGSLCEVPDGPLRLGPQQGPQGRTIGKPLRFHDTLQAERLMFGLEFTDRSGTGSRTCETRESRGQ